MSNISYRFTSHALQEIERRNIPMGIVQTIVQSPQQILDTRGGRKVYQ